MNFDIDFKKNFRLEGWITPTMITSVVDGKKYAISGSNWIHIPNDMTYEDIKNGFIDLTPIRTKEKHNDFYKEVKSSKGNTTYKVSFISGQWSCNCSGFSFRRKCTHIDNTKTELKKIF